MWVNYMMKYHMKHQRKPHLLKQKNLQISFLQMLEDVSIFHLQQYATKLSDIKSRSKAAKRKAVMQKQDCTEHQAQVMDPRTPKVESLKEETSPPGKSSAEKVPKGNLILLRKKLEENRYEQLIACHKGFTIILLLGLEYF